MGTNYDIVALSEKQFLASPGIVCAYLNACLDNKMIIRFG